MKENPPPFKLGGNHALTLRGGLSLPRQREMGFPRKQMENDPHLFTWVENWPSIVLGIWGICPRPSDTGEELLLPFAVDGKWPFPQK